eukprot:g3660.t1
MSLDNSKELIWGILLPIHGEGKKENKTENALTLPSPKFPNHAACSETPLFLWGQKVLIGRGEDNHIKLQSKFISGHHCHFKFKSIQSSPPEPKDSIVDFDLTKYIARKQEPTPEDKNFPWDEQVTLVDTSSNGTFVDQKSLGGGGKSKKKLSKVQQIDFGRDAQGGSYQLFLGFAYVTRSVLLQQSGILFQRHYNRSKKRKDHGYQDKDAKKTRLKHRTIDHNISLNSSTATANCSTTTVDPQQHLYKTIRSPPQQQDQQKHQRQGSQQRRRGPFDTPERDYFEMQKTIEKLKKENTDLKEQYRSLQESADLSVKRRQDMERDYNKLMTLNSSLREKLKEKLEKENAIIEEKQNLVFELSAACKREAQMKNQAGQAMTILRNLLEGNTEKNVEGCPQRNTNEGCMERNIERTDTTRIDDEPPQTEVPQTEIAQTETCGDNALHSDAEMMMMVMDNSNNEVLEKSINSEEMLDNMTTSDVTTLSSPNRSVKSIEVASMEPTNAVQKEESPCRERNDKEAAEEEETITVGDDEHQENQNMSNEIIMPSTDANTTILPTSMGEHEQQTPGLTNGTSTTKVKDQPISSAKQSRDSIEEDDKKCGSVDERCGSVPSYLLSTAG